MDDGYNLVEVQNVGIGGCCEVVQDETNGNAKFVN